MIVLSLVSAVAGIALTVFCLETAVDPYWPRSTRISSVVGLILGLAMMTFGIVSFLVVMSR